MQISGNVPDEPEEPLLAMFSVSACFMCREGHETRDPTGPKPTLFMRCEKKHCIATLAGIGATTRRQRISRGRPNFYPKATAKCFSWTAQSQFFKGPTHDIHCTSLEQGSFRNFFEILKILFQFF